MLDRSVQYIRGIGPKKSSVLLDEAGIDTVEDLLYYAPRRYLDRSSFSEIRNCFVNETVTVGGTIKSVRVLGARRRFLEVVIDDGTDTLAGVFFAGIPYFQRIFVPGETVLFSGRIEFFRKKQMVHPEYDFIDEDSQIQSIHTGRVVPLYPSTEKLKANGFDSRGFRRIIRFAIDNYLASVEDPLPEDFRSRLRLMPLHDALFSLHFPDTMEMAENARRRLSFNELFFLQYYISMSRQKLRDAAGTQQRIADTDMLSSFIANLPFRLTADQAKTIDEIAHDMRNPFPMNRLLQGDVGSGKTVVAMAASLFACGRGQQTAVMAPTEILARQHYESFAAFMPSAIKILLLTGGTSQSERKAVHEAVAGGEAQILIGTHALIQNDVDFNNLGLIVIDEQHRFGVNQRAQLRIKGDNPDLLIMTATPIPRSLSLTLYGDLDVSSIREKPSTRIPVRTMAFPESRLPGVYRSIEKYISEGRQVYYVLPLVEESQKIDLKSAVETHRLLSTDTFPHRRVELLHGKMSSAEKDDIMARFKNGGIDILVSTTVIEVGIDVPNATVMVIAHAERFGLSQLHQLRGRVGRGAHQSFCVLVHPDSVAPEGLRRIEAITATDDGFAIAEEDLKLRGSGELIGIKQHGHFSGFEFADLAKDLDLITLARDEAVKIASRDAGALQTNERMSVDGRYAEMFNRMRTKRILSILS